MIERGTIRPIDSILFEEGRPLHDLALSIAMLAVFALVAGAIWLIFKRRDRKRGVLMLLAAVVIAANVAIWAMPVPG